MLNHWWEVRCDGCGCLIAHTPSTQPLPGLYCSPCMETERAEREAEDSQDEQG